ncbi:DUF6232 family protein [Streptomyces sp. NPDC003401]|nr:hypothetical protein TAW4_04545 [Streptomyces griseoflavus]
MEAQGTIGAPMLPPPPPAKGTAVVLKVSKRLLWVGEAAYPLRNIARVHTFVLKPKRMEAFSDFLKGVAYTVVALAVIQAINASNSSGRAADDSAQVLWVLGLTVLVWLFSRMLKAWASPDEHVLAVETSSGSTALVTLPDPAQLKQLVLYITHTIEHPEAEFQVWVQSLQVNPRNYQFGDTVNMYGGLNHTGMVKK